MATLEGCRGKESMPWSFFSHLGLGPGSLVPEFPHGFPTQLGTLSNTRGMGAGLGSDVPEALTPYRKGQSPSPSPLASSHCCACLLHPSRTGLSSAACTPTCGLMSWPLPLSFQLEQASCTPGISVQEIPACLAPPQQASILYLT